MKIDIFDSPNESIFYFLSKTLNNPIFNSDSLIWKNLSIHFNSNERTTFYIFTKPYMKVLTELFELTEEEVLNIIITFFKFELLNQLWLDESLLNYDYLFYYCFNIKRIY